MVDGVFGLRTERAVKDFQVQSGLEATGEVDLGCSGDKTRSGQQPSTRT